MAKIRRGPGKATEPKREMTIGEVAKLGGEARQKQLRDGTTKEQRTQMFRDIANARWNPKKANAAA